MKDHKLDCRGHIFSNTHTYAADINGETYNKVNIGSNGYVFAIVIVKLCNV